MTIEIKNNTDKEAVVNDEPLVSIVVLNYNGSDVIERCISSILNTKYSNFELILIDNNSTDGSFEFVKKFFSNDSHITLIANHTNLGYAEGYNVGARVSQGKYIVFINNDTEVRQEWLKELIRVMESDSSVGACESKIVMMDNPNMVSYSGGRMDHLGFLLRKAPEDDMGQYDYLHEIFSAMGVCVAFRSAVLKEVGLFDQKIFIHNEITDLCWRIRLRGYKVVWVPTSVISHVARLGHNSKKYSDKLKLTISFHATKNHLLVLIKNYSLKNLIKYMPIVILLRLIEFVYLLLNGKHLIASAKIRAILWVLFHARDIYRDRCLIQSYVRRVSDDSIMSFMQKPNLFDLFHHLKDTFIKS